MNKTWYTHTMEYYSAIKHKFSNAVTACMNLEIVILHERD